MYVVVRIGVITDPPLQESVSDPQTLLDALEEPVAEPLTLSLVNGNASVFDILCVSILSLYSLYCISSHRSPRLVLEQYCQTPWLLL